MDQDTQKTWKEVLFSPREEEILQVEELFVFSFLLLLCTCSIQLGPK